MLREILPILFFDWYKKIRKGKSPVSDTTGLGMDAHNHLQIRTFKDLLDLTKASDVIQWLSPDPTSSSTNATEPISWQGS